MNMSTSNTIHTPPLDERIVNAGMTVKQFLRRANAQRSKASDVLRARRLNRGTLGFRPITSLDIDYWSSDNLGKPVSHRWLEAIAVVFGVTLDELCP